MTLASRQYLLASTFACLLTLEVEKRGDVSLPLSPQQREALLSSAVSALASLLLTQQEVISPETLTSSRRIYLRSEVRRRTTRSLHHEYFNRIWKQHESQRKVLDSDFVVMINNNFSPELSRRQNKSCLVFLYLSGTKVAMCFALALFCFSSFSPREFGFPWLKSKCLTVSSASSSLFERKR